jgi:hypothetical protein
MMEPGHAGRTTIVAFAVAFALGAGLGACGGREEPKTGNPGGKPQSPGVETGTNPAQSAQTATSGDTSTLGATIKPKHKSSSKQSP